MKKQPEITAKTREAIIKAFCSVAKEKPIEKVTVKEITELAGYNRATFYRYFTDVFNIQEYIEKTIINELLAKAKIKLDTKKFDDTFFNLFLEMYEINRDKLMVLLNDRNRSHFIAQIKKTLVSMIEPESSGTPSENKRKIIMDIYYSGVFSALGEWIQNPGDVSTEEFLEIIKNLFITWYYPACTCTPGPLTSELEWL